MLSVRSSPFSREKNNHTCLGVRFFPPAHAQLFGNGVVCKQCQGQGIGRNRSLCNGCSYRMGLFPVKESNGRHDSLVSRALCPRLDNMSRSTL